MTADEFRRLAGCMLDTVYEHSHVAEEYEPIDIEEIDQATDKAALVKLAGHRRKVWLPFSQLADIEGEVNAKTWLLEEKGLL